MLGILSIQAVGVDKQATLTVDSGKFYVLIVITTYDVMATMIHEENRRSLAILRMLHFPQCNENLIGYEEMKRKK